MFVHVGCPILSSPLLMAMPAAEREARIPSFPPSPPPPPVCRSELSVWIFGVRVCILDLVFRAGGFSGSVQCIGFRLVLVSAYKDLLQRVRDLQYSMAP